MMSTGRFSYSRHSLLLAALAFSAVLIVGYGSDLILKRHPDWMIADDLILGLGAGIVVLHYEKERGRLLIEKLRIIRDINSSVRNELQVLYACLEHPEKLRVSVIERSVERIDWALREMLPGREHSTVPPPEQTGERDEDNVRRSA